MADQCCPMDTYDTDSAGNLRPVCTCGDDCECMCLDCACEGWGEEYDEPRTYGDLWVTGPSLVELDAGERHDHRT